MLPARAKFGCGGRPREAVDHRLLLGLVQPPERLAVMRQAVAVQPVQGLHILLARFQGAAAQQQVGKVRASHLLAGSGRAQEARLPTEIVDNFHRALKAGDTGRVLSMMDRELIVFEYGVADLKLEAYAFAHLPMDMDQAARTQWELQTRRMGGAGDERWVLSTYHVTGPAGANTPAIDQTTAETVILRRIGDGFRIAHVHWSTADVRK